MGVDDARDVSDTVTMARGLLKKDITGLSCERDELRKELEELRGSLSGPRGGGTVNRSIGSA